MTDPKPARRRPAEPLDPAEEHPDEQRLHKVLAHAGVGSRRHCEDLIREGRVTVDGQTIREVGTKVDPAVQRITVDGQAVRTEPLVYFLVNKPKGVLSTTADPQGRPRVIDLLPHVPQRVYTVGRLDEQSEGLMLMTNDGELANRLAHPRYGVPKTYRAQVAGHPRPEVLEQLTRGVFLSEGRARARRVKRLGKRGDSTVLEIVLTEGHNREIRRMLARLGHKVLNLTRTRIANLRLAGLKPGRSRRLSAAELDGLRAWAYRGSAGAPARRRRPGGKERRGSQRTPSPARAPADRRADRP